MPLQVVTREMLLLLPAAHCFAVVEESSTRSLPPFKSCRILPSRDAAVSPLQGDDGYIIHILSHKCPLPIVENSSEKSLPLFKFSMPFHLAIQIVCTDHWSARNCWWTPEHGARHHSVTCISHLLTLCKTRISVQLRFSRDKFTVPLFYAASKRYCRGKRQGKNTC